jgi:serine/threonine protein kinase/tetratricopeptide (TPR) repeat protein
MGEQSNRAKAIFLAAIDEHTPDQWPAFLEQACAGDVHLRAEVEKLLRAHTQMGSFHEVTEAEVPAAIDSPLSERPGSVIGPYKLLEQIGEGGFGVVFMAEQQQPIGRRVALKILKPGMDSKQVLTRFETERQVLALMDHSKIARVLDAGATDSGRPYFVMELVNGGPITKFCDQNLLSPQARLKLFVDVCQAIQHAHHKGVIHRDIKPSNVLVTLHEGKPVVKVIDFGIAKALAQKGTERTLFTAQGQMIGTPEYMSPEQAEINELDIDTRTDVYALGVLLYELLTGTTPLEGKRLREAGYAEMQRLIREEEVPRPSARLLALGTAATVLADNRGLEVKRLVQLLAGDLDWIMMKALEKDRNRRYETPGSFAADIKRYLRREAVLARPPSTLYKVKRFTQRHLTGVLMASALVLALVKGAAVATWLAVVATHAKQEAQTREAETKAVLEFMEKRILVAARPEGMAGGLGHEVTLRRALEAALPYVENNFKDQPLIEARLRLTLGRSFLYLGKPQLAAEQDEAARAIYTSVLGPDHPNTLMSAHNLGSDYAALGRSADALQLRETTLAQRKARLGPEHRDTLKSTVALANSWDQVGRHADALALRWDALARQKATLGPDDPDTLATMNGLACCSGALGRHDQAVELLEEALTRYKATVGPEHPDALRCMANLASNYSALGQHTLALQLREQTLALMQAKLGPDHPMTQVSTINLAWSLATVPDASLRDPARAVEYASLVTELAPRNEIFRSTLGAARFSVGDWKGAIADLERAINLRKPDDPVNATDGFFLAMAHWQMQEKDKARAWFARAGQWMEKGETHDPDPKRFRAEAATLLGIDRKDETLPRGRGLAQASGHDREQTRRPP